MLLSINGTSYSSFHFVGILGSGMSALAQYLRFAGATVSGSDRQAGRDDTAAVHHGLAAIGCTVVPQDGSGISATTQAIVISTAIEESNADIAAARSRAIAVFHRSDVLAAIITTRRTIAVAGTSGKSTVTAMIFELLQACGASPSLISGAGLRTLETQGYIGNAFFGTGDLLVIEADESDGTLVKYHPYISIILNISKDHKSVDETIPLFAALAAQSQIAITNHDDPQLQSIAATTTFGLLSGADCMPQQSRTAPTESTLTINDVNYTVPVPGAHNLSNALAALCVCKQLAINETELASALAGFKGVARRFAQTKTDRNIIVIDDYAHNPEKIKAAIQTAQQFCVCVHAIFQPHGFGPLRFLKNDFVAAFSMILRPDDHLYLLPVYYAGGTVSRDVSSDDVAKLLKPDHARVYTPANRSTLLTRLSETVRPGEAVLLMGARDPSLPALYRQIIQVLSGEI